MILTDPLLGSGAETALQRWLDQQPSSLRHQIELALHGGIRAEAIDLPACRTVVVCARERARRDTDPVRLAVPEVLRLAQQPLHLLLEDGESDLCFVLSVATDPWRRRLEVALERGWIRSEHKGGLPRMIAYVHREATSFDSVARLWVMFDSDARAPGEPSDESEALRRACRSRGVAHHQLRRRAIENYIPLQALHCWVYLGSGHDRTRRRQMVEAFGSMSRDQRSHYNMKEGFDRDEASAPIPELFGTWTACGELRRGFGRRIGQLFRQEELQLQEAWFVRDGQQEETRPMIQSLLRWM